MLQQCLLPACVRACVRLYMCVRARARGGGGVHVSTQVFWVHSHHRRLSLWLTSHWVWDRATCTQAFVCICLAALLTRVVRYSAIPLRVSVRLYIRPQCSAGAGSEVVEPRGVCIEFPRAA